MSCCVNHIGLGALIQPDFWDIDFASKDFTPEQLVKTWLPQEGEVMLEEESDNCITELLGTGSVFNNLIKVLIIRTLTAIPASYQ